MRRAIAPLPALALALAVSLAVSLAPAPARAGARADSLDALVRPTRRDAVFALAAGAATALVSLGDWRGSNEAAKADSRFALDLAADARRVGDPTWAAPVLVAADGIARLAHGDGVAAASERIAFSAVAAGVATLVVKVSAGRWRPDESPGSAGRFDPFTNHDSFPSGHATTAFALVSALDTETSTRWVPAIGYPVAALTAWSRVRDRRHWPSDVVAGAAVGAWVARRADLVARRRWPRGLLVAVWPSHGGGNVTVAGRW